MGELLNDNNQLWDENKRIKVINRKLVQENRDLKSKREALINLVNSQTLLVQALQGKIETDDKFRVIYQEAYKQAMDASRQAAVVASFEWKYHQNHPN